VTDLVRAHQQSALVLHAIPWPDPSVRAAQVSARHLYPIPWPDPVARSHQISLQILYDPDGDVPQTMSAPMMLVQIV
jgi:hypothetical protein